MRRSPPERIARRVRTATIATPSAASRLSVRHATSAARPAAVHGDPQTRPEPRHFSVGLERDRHTTRVRRGRLGSSGIVLPTGRPSNPQVVRTRRTQQEVPGCENSTGGATTWGIGASPGSYITGSRPRGVRRRAPIHGTGLREPPQPSHMRRPRSNLFDIATYRL